MKAIKYPASNSGWTAEEWIKLAKQCFNEAKFGELIFNGSPVLTFGSERNDIKIAGTEQMKMGREIVVTWTASTKNGREFTSVTATAVITVLSDESGKRYPWRVRVLLGKSDHTGHVQAHKTDEVAIQIAEH